MKRLNVLIIGAASSKKQDVVERLVPDSTSTSSLVQQYHDICIQGDQMFLLEVLVLNTNFEFVNAFKQHMAAADIVLICINSDASDSVEKLKYFRPLLALIQRQARVQLVNTAGGCDEKAITAIETGIMALDGIMCGVIQCIDDIRDFVLTTQNDKSLLDKAKVIKGDDQQIVEAILSEQKQGVQKHDREAETRAKAVVDFYQRLGVNSQNPTYLDVGCGNGAVSRLIKEKICASKLALLDVLEQQFEEGITYYRADLNAIKSAPTEEKYDVITFMAALHHVRDHENAFKILSSMLSDDSVLILQDFLVEDPADVARRDLMHCQFFVLSGEMSPADFYSNFFTHYVSRFTLERALEKAGLKLDYVSGPIGNGSRLMAIRKQ